MAFSDEMDKMMQDVVGVMGESVTLFRPNTDSGANFTTGARGRTYTTVNCSANIHPKRMIDSPIGGAKGKQWEITFELRIADLPATPTPRWRIAEGADADEDASMEIVSVDLDANNRGAVVVARRAI